MMEELRSELRFEYAGSREVTQGALEALKRNDGFKWKLWRIRVAVVIRTGRGTMANDRSEEMVEVVLGLREGDDGQRRHEGPRQAQLLPALRCTVRLGRGKGGTHFCTMTYLMHD